MRKLSYVQYDYERQEALALDENGELWFGKLEATDDGRRVIEWTPVNTPRDGAGFSEPQMSFFDQWERKARERIATEAGRDAVPLATSREDEPDGSGPETEGASDDGVQDGEGDHPAQ